MVPLLRRQIEKGKISEVFLRVLATMINQVSGLIVYNSHPVFAINLSVMLKKTMQNLTNYCIKR